MRHGAPNGANGGALSMQCKQHAKVGFSDGVLSWWRTRPRQSFDAKARSEVKTFLRNPYPRNPRWRAAIDGDAAAAVGIALRLKAPLQPSARVDRAMTVLLACAFDNAAAAHVLVHMVRRTQLAPRKRAVIATSWLARHAACARPANRTGLAALAATRDGRTP
jgi:hypothetical protein